MGFQINFQKAKRNYMLATFEEEKEGKESEKQILVGMPKKRIFDALLDIQKTANEANKEQTEEEKNEINRQLINEMYNLTAEILSCNKQGERIPREWVEEQMTVQELKEFFGAYTKFAKGEAESPN